MERTARSEASRALVLLTIFVIGVVLAAIAFSLYLGPILERLVPQLLGLLRAA